MLMQSLYSELESAMESELVVKVLDLLVDIAELNAQNDDKTSAAEIVALVMEYPVRPVTMERAAMLFAMLECELCPRVIYDAHALAQEMTLDEMVLRVLSGAKGQNV
ncbi:MAG: hypothetical protein SGJ24_14315 [Chloroflexota bacterium]|nr:hypothetical protein [Chloroflexota bacterium]